MISLCDESSQVSRLVPCFRKRFHCHHSTFWEGEHVSPFSDKNGVVASENITTEPKKKKASEPCTVQVVPLSLTRITKSLPHTIENYFEVAVVSMPDIIAVLLFFKKSRLTHSREAFMHWNDDYCFHAFALSNWLAFSPATCDLGEHGS